MEIRLLVVEHYGCMHTWKNSTQTKNSDGMCLHYTQAVLLMTQTCSPGRAHCFVPLVISPSPSPRDQHIVLFLVISPWKQDTGQQTLPLSPLFLAHSSSPMHIGIWPALKTSIFGSIVTKKKIFCSLSPLFLEHSLSPLRNLTWSDCPPACASMTNLTKAKNSEPNF